MEIKIQRYCQRSDLSEGICREEHVRKEEEIVGKCLINENSEK